MNERLKSVT